MVSAPSKAIMEIADRTWRLQSVLDGRNVFQYLLAAEERDELLLVDTGTTNTPRDVVVPALRHLGLSPEAIRLVLVTHPDVDHQGGLAALMDLCPSAVSACGFADRPLVSQPEQLLLDRYQPYLREHGLGYPPEEERWIRAHYGAPAEIVLTLAGGELLRVGERAIDVLHAPGHSAGHLVLFERESRRLFSSDAIHLNGCPAADGEPALCPTYEDVDAYLGSIDLVETLAPSELHSGHWPAQTGPDVGHFLTESRAFVERVDNVLLDRLEEPATLAELCETVQLEAGPWRSEPRMLMFAVHGHLRRLLRRRAIECLAPTARPPRYRARTLAETAAGATRIGQPEAR